MFTATDVRPRPGSDFAELCRRVRAAGLLRRRRGYYGAKIALNLTALITTCAVFVVLGDSWWQLLTAAAFAVLFGQLAFIGHDAGHKQIFRGRRANDVVGFVHGSIVGLSYSWWTSKHNGIMPNPNNEDEDPDLQIPALAFTLGQIPGKRGMLRWITKYQAYLFFPLPLLEGPSLRVSSAQAIWRGHVRSRRLELTLLLTNSIGYLTAVFIVLSPGKAVLFIAVHQALWSVYMGCVFAPDHKGNADAVLRAFTGLPPQPNLRRAQILVQDFCAEHDIPYAQCGPVRSYRYVLTHLHAIGATLRLPSSQT